MKIQKEKLFYALFFIICLKPVGINYFKIIDYCVNLLKVIIFLYYILYYLINVFKGRFKRFSCTNILMLLYGAVLLPTVINHGAFFQRIMEMASTIMLSIFLEKNKCQVKSILESWFWVIAGYMPINLLSIALGAIAFEESMAIYFLGSKNTWGSLLSVYCFIIYYYSQTGKTNRIIADIVFGLIIINVMVTGSTTAIIELIIIVGFWIFKKLKLIRKVSNYWVLIIVYGISNAILFSSAWWGKIIYYMDAYFSKGAFSFTARVRMWQAGFKVFLSHPFIGVGKLTESVWKNNILGVGYHTQLHNQIIEYLATGGLLLISIYIVFLIRTGKNIQKFNMNKIAYALNITIFVQNVGVLTEAKYFAEFYLLFVLSSYIDNIIKSIRPLNPSIVLSDKLLEKKE